MGVEIRVENGNPLARYGWAGPARGGARRMFGHRGRIPNGPTLCSLPAARMGVREAKPQSVEAQPRHSAARRSTRRGRADDAQLLLLGGIVLCLSMLVLYLGIITLDGLEKDGVGANADQRAIVMYRVFRDDLQSAVVKVVTPDRNLDGLGDLVIGDIITSELTDRAFRTGFHFNLDLAPAAEARIHTTQYNEWSEDGSYHYTSPFDGADDGIIWQSTCPVEGASSAGCATGLFLTTHFDSAAEGVELTEDILLAVNTG